MSDEEKVIFLKDISHLETICTRGTSNSSTYKDKLIIRFWGTLYTTSEISQVFGMILTLNTAYASICDEYVLKRKLLLTVQ